MAGFRPNSEIIGKFRWKDSASVLTLDFGKNFLFSLSIITIFTVLILIGSFAHHRTSWNLINSSSKGAGWNLFGLIINEYTWTKIKVYAAPT